MRRAATFYALALAAAVICAATPAAAQSPLDLLFGNGKHRRANAHKHPQSAPVKPSEAEKKPQTPKEKAKAPQKEAVRAKPQKPAETVSPAAPAPYEPQMARLAEVLGGLAFLRDLCPPGDGDDWRDKMTALLNADTPTGPRRERLVAGFNRSFRGYELTYRACTPNAEVAITRYLDEAERLTRDMTYRYGNP